MHDISDRFRQSASDGGKMLGILSCTPPGGEPMQLPWEACSVTCDSNSASRYGANSTVTPPPGADLFSLVTTPGAVFTIEHGYDFGGDVTELIPMGVYELARDGADIFGGGIAIDLVDQWARLDRAKFLAPYTPAASTRAHAIAVVVAAAIPGVTIRIESEGGSFLGGTTWDRSRTQMITDLATDGGLDVYFNGSGEFVIREEPIISPAAAVWTFKSGDESNIKTADRERPFDKLYNAVMVLPQDQSQAWAAQLVEISDTSHPLHKDKYGQSTFFWSSPTIHTAAEALTAGATILQRFQGTTELLTISSFGNSALEAGDVTSVVQESTETDPGFAALHLLESFAFDLATADLSAATRSSTLAELEDAA